MKSIAIIAITALMTTTVCVLAGWSDWWMVACAALLVTVPVRMIIRGDI